MRPSDRKQEGELKGVILDLRGNPGGLLNEAVNISNLFVERGQEIVSTRGKIREMDKSYKAQNNPLDPQLPVAVLVNSGPASARRLSAVHCRTSTVPSWSDNAHSAKALYKTTRPLSPQCAIEDHDRQILHPERPVYSGIGLFPPQ